MRTIRQRFFVVRELRLSILMMILLSFMAAVGFMYLIKIFGGTIKEHTLAAYLIVMLGYAMVVVLLTLFFAHRFVGPFERLRLELSLVLSGDYQRRLGIRKHDDVYVRSFVEDVNKLIERLSSTVKSSDQTLKDIDSKLDKMILKMADGDEAVQKYRKEFLSLRKKINTCRLRPPNAPALHPKQLSSNK